MTEQHPITPPPAFLIRLRKEAPVYRDFGVTREEWIATQASRWGWEQRGADIEAELQKARDEELEACCEWLAKRYGAHLNIMGLLYAYRRPKPLSLKEQALDALNEADQGLNESEWQQRSDTIRRALEALDD